ncbi:hypothetical protein HYPSUDRAFT_218388 [Hypholoma sublateritium FD-334 SS-4]|uniref:Epidermal growth factor receptor-like transmembrane-juxtamembrane segment domain-containing protein n=1 Tax=Hypholoma sublateritium (strain FD-334 SS-4) TaxID=945553 RepID=A0A0D2KU51_HYPSF|nr:hypothetical protein HYPSUDRAFT_218388 [Hypholoma sublateritium FD-334 SS-4]
MSSSPPVSIIVDDGDVDYFTFPSGSVSPSLGNLPFSIFYGSTAQRTDPATNGTSATFVTISFNGTKVMLYGNRTSLDSAFDVHIDGAEPIVYEVSTAQGYGAFFETLPLADGAHNVTLANVIDTTVDFAVVSVNATTSLAAARPVIVDDADASVAYTGDNWTSMQSMRGGNAYEILDAQASTSALPYQQTTHLTTSPGDFFNFTFAGSALAVYGMKDFTILGSLELRFTLDGVPEDTGHAVAAGDAQFLAGLTQPNFLWYEAPADLAPGVHALGVEVLACESLPFVVDYITFLPSDPSVSSDVPSTPAGSSSKKGSIAGGVVGGIVFLALVALLFDCMRRRKRQTRTRFVYPFQHGMRPRRSAIRLDSISFPANTDLDAKLRSV